MLRRPTDLPCPLAPNDGVSADAVAYRCRAHLVGIAGAGMRALADVLLGWGWQLGGSDLAIDSADGLADRGIRLFPGHAVEHVSPRTQWVIHSDAVGDDNPELRQAARLGIPVCSYFEMAGRLMSIRYGLAVAGTHGKSTTIAMAAEILVDAGADPTVLCGAAPMGRTSGGRAGRGELMLVEACEYRANFLRLRPRHAVILGIEPDHFDYYRSPEQLQRAFAQFARSVPPDGLVLARHDCQATRRITTELPCRVETFGIGGGADWSAENLPPIPEHTPLSPQAGRGVGAEGFSDRLFDLRRACYPFDIRRHGRHLCRVSLQVPGRHNVLNALAAAALAWHNGVAPEGISHALGRFRGLTRRFEILGTWRGVLLVDDYAHHPTEVVATLETLRQMLPGRRVWCVFQPHQVSRTTHLLDELAASLQNADRVLVAEVFRAREGHPRPGEVTAADLARRVRRGGVEVQDIHNTERIARLLVGRLLPGDVLITMGAGDIRKVCDGMVRRFRVDRAAR